MHLSDSPQHVDAKDALADTCKAIAKSRTQQTFDSAHQWVDTFNGDRFTWATLQQWRQVRPGVPSSKPHEF
jgi:hypothetical protein